MSTFASPDQAMAAGAAGAVEVAAQANVRLDYSPDSIRAVEEQLASLHQAIPKGFLAKLKKKGPADAEILLMAMTFGAYVGEVLRRHLGGHWSEDNRLEAEVKLPTLHLGKSGDEVWPQIKVEKRLRNGPEDDVWHYAQILVAKLNAEGVRDA